MHGVRTIFCALPLVLLILYVVYKTMQPHKDYDETMWQQRRLKRRHVEQSTCTPRKKNVHFSHVEPEYFEEEAPTVQSPSLANGQGIQQSPNSTISTNNGAVLFANSAPPMFNANASPQSIPVVNPSVVDQSVVDFSDVLVSDVEKQETVKALENVSQVESVNDRFEAAKRKGTENRLKPGVYDTKGRRKIIEALLRRPHCGRRTRSWRTENSDIIRGDVIPKSNTTSWGLMGVGGKNPDVDLHPGALGPMAGLQGKWLAEENVASSIFDGNADNQG